MRSGGGGLVDGYPPSFFNASTIRAVRGFVLQPRWTPEGREGGMVIISFQVPKTPSAFSLDRLRIFYRQPGRPFTLNVEHGLQLCSARDAKCDPEHPPGA